jgi:hypothetical protein
MKDITKIFVFDFDETLFRMPGYTDRFSVERLNPELDFPDPYSFYDHPSSMDPEIHNIQLIEPVYDDWLRASKDPTAITILITHRIEELKHCVDHLLEKYGISFDRCYFLGRKTEKILILKSELEKTPTIKEIRVYEDSLEQLKKYQQFFHEYVLTIQRSATSLSSLMTLNMQLVDKSKVISLHSFTAGESRRIELKR